MTLRTLLLSLLALYYATVAPAREQPRGPEALSVQPERTIVIAGPIAQGNIAHLGDLLLTWAKQNKMSADIVISSPGGEIITGELFISQMAAAQALGLQLRCFVPDIAASMAFSILLQCDERYVLARSFLLWHRARVMLGGLFGVPMTAPQLLSVGRDLETIDNLQFVTLRDGLSMPEADVRYHFENETLHYGMRLAAIAPDFCESHVTIPGLFEALANPKLPRSKVFSNEMFVQQGQIVYIHEMFLPATVAVGTPQRHK